MEKDILQSLKLEISKNFSLAPYERIAFHKILALQKSENGMKILLRDVMKGGVIRKSALSVLKDYDNRDVATVLLDLLVTSQDLLPDELFHIFDHVYRYGSKESAPALKEYISHQIDKTEFAELTARAVFTLGSVGRDDAETLSYIKSIIENPSMFEKIRCAAIESFIHDFDSSFMEKLLRENNDRIAFSVYRSISEIADKEMLHYEETSEDEIFTVMPGQDDRVLLDIRVLLGKMSPSFDKYSRETKTAYIMAMIMSGHREFIIYTMKALTSNDHELIDQTLYVILSNTEKLRQPDKLLRSLISLPSVTTRDTNIIVEIFSRYFKLMKESRNNMMFRDKICNYLIVTLDAYFESYRKNFMIPEIMEKDHLPEVQSVRNYILRNFDPDIKRRLMTFLLAEDWMMLKKMIGEISESVSYVDDSDDKAFAGFIEMLIDKDQKTREISASRIDDIDFEKRYMKNRIIRICEVIARLGIDEASANLVKMFNYVKKYYDEEIYLSVTKTLSVLNYPYMLGELELQLASGDVTEQERSLRLFPYFDDQRSLNIMLDYVKDHIKDNSNIMIQILMIIAKRDVVGNVAVNEIVKHVIKENEEPSVRKICVELVGHCGFENDIEYLNNLFILEADATVKESVVQSFDLIMQNSRDYDRNVILGYFKEYMKDPGIRVRMYACSILLKLGQQEALVSIREMMVIKNRQIQRDILLVLGNLMTAEIAFFLISLLKEDYAISGDIVPLLKYLKPEELNEVDHFVVNLFKKYEGINLDGVSGAQGQYVDQEIKGYSREVSSILMLDILNYADLTKEKLSIEMALVFKNGYKRIIDVVAKSKGTVSRSTAGRLLAFFPEIVSAAEAAMAILGIIRGFNSAAAFEFQLASMLFISVSETDFVNSEVILPSEREFDVLKGSPLSNRIFFSGEIAQTAERAFRCGRLPEAMFPMTGMNNEFRELLNVNNFQMKAEIIIKKLQIEEDQRIEAQKLIESGSREDRGKRTKNTIAFSNAMEGVGKILRHDLTDISKYVGKRSNDRELIRNVEKMLDDAYRHYMLQVSKTVIE